MRRNHVNAKAAETAKEESFEKMLCALCDLCVQRDSFTSSYHEATKDHEAHHVLSCLRESPLWLSQTARPDAGRLAVHVALRYSPRSREPDIASPTTLPLNL